jgi:hypothetical protein
MDIYPNQKLQTFKKCIGQNLYKIRLRTMPYIFKIINHFNIIQIKMCKILNIKWVKIWLKLEILKVMTEIFKR